MEFEIGDDPQDSECMPEGQRDGGLVEDHIALRNQSGVGRGDYSPDNRRYHSLAEALDRGG